MKKTFIIAEAGVNHNGDLRIAKKLVDIAAAAGADAIKFQTFKTENLVSRSAQKAEYQKTTTWKTETQFEMLKKLELPFYAYRELFYYCKEKNIVFMSTPFDIESVDMLDNLGMTIFKIPSGEITNKPLIKYIAAKKKPVILSTGMSYIGEVEKAISWINEIWNSLNVKPQLTLLHCVSNYPSAVEDVNLLAIKTMEMVFKLPVGYSDHTMGIEIPTAAVAMGAVVIEKHFTLDRNMSGPDHKASLDPCELNAMVKAIRNVEKAMGDGVKRPASNEQDTRDMARRSLVVKRDMKIGEIISLDDIAIKRPGTGIKPEFMEVVAGMKITRDISSDSVITWEMIKK